MLFCSAVSAINLYTVKAVFRDHTNEVIKVVAYTRWSLNTGSIGLIEGGLLYQISGLLKQWIAL